MKPGDCVKDGIWRGRVVFVRDGFVSVHWEKRWSAGTTMEWGADLQPCVDA